MQRLEFVKGDNLSSINRLLQDGWNIEKIVPVAQPGFLGQYGNVDGMVGAYVYLLK